MARFPSRLLTRLAVCSVGGLALAAAATAGFWSGSGVSARPWLSLLPSVNLRPPAEEPGTGAAPDPSASRSPHHHVEQPAKDEEEDDEAAVFAALERLERRMAAGMSRARDAVVAIEYSSADSPPGTRRLATGVVINSSGDVLSVRIDRPPPTTAPAAGILARDAAGRRHVVQWMASDPETGLTLLKIPPEAVKPIVMAGEGPILGSQVFVVGNPLGLGHSVSRGHIAGLDRALKLGHRQVGGLIQVQAPLYPGDSGAVVTNPRGQLLGLIRSGLAMPSGSGEPAGRDNDFGFAIGTRDLLWIADQLRARGHVDRAYLGVRLRMAALADTSSAGTAANDQVAPAVLDGAYLQDVVAGTPAAKAGLQAGDAIIAIDGEPIHSAPDLTDRLDRLAAHATVRLDVLRGFGPARQRLRFELQTTSRPDLEQASRPPAAPQPGSIPPPASPPVQVAGSPSPTAKTSTSGPEPGDRPAMAAPPVTIIPTAAAGMPAAGPAPAGEPAAATPLETGLATPRAPEPTASAVSSPPPATSPLPLRAAVQPVQAGDLKLTLPQAVTQRLDQVERRLEKLERLGPAGSAATPAPGKAP